MNQDEKDRLETKIGLFADALEKASDLAERAEDAAEDGAYERAEALFKRATDAAATAIGHGAVMSGAKPLRKVVVKVKKPRAARPDGNAGDVTPAPATGADF